MAMDDLPLEKEVRHAIGTSTSPQMTDAMTLDDTSSSEYLSSISDQNDDSDRLVYEEHLPATGSDGTGSRPPGYRNTSDVFLPDRYFAETAAFPYLQLRSEAHCDIQRTPAAALVAPPGSVDGRARRSGSSCLSNPNHIDWSS
ncbi:PREDICTED: uncharacterized protein LOC106806860 [Priapulus caudatus]|uniref:Uncharacterized protein LOC106806860 n=1 Tax=Priapulus caudatus TaxID=37621 RepID=A0ABM1DX10_PRICU|nr:PREDICTED: uncharacterized protein LOC106806860 [Priapulus caudatus]